MIDMNNKLLQLLEYPGEFIYGLLALSGCEQGGRYSRVDFHCSICPDGDMCAWVNDLINNPLEMSDQTFSNHLEYALDRMQVHAGVEGHDILACPCDICSWIRDAMAALKKSGCRQ